MKVYKVSVKIFCIDVLSAGRSSTIIFQSSLKSISLVAYQTDTIINIADILNLNIFLVESFMQKIYYSLFLKCTPTLSKRESEIWILRFVQNEKTPTSPQPSPREREKNGFFTSFRMTILLI